MKNPDASSNNSSALSNSLDVIEVFIKGVAEKYSISYNEVLELLRKKENKDIVLVPSFILRDKNLGILESVAKYMKEELNLTYHKIAVLLNRDDRVIWVTYNKAIKKKKSRLAVSEPNYWLPVSIFTDTSLGPLEAISKYLVDDAKLDFAQIAKLLNRDKKSIWACYKKAKKR